MHRVFAYLLKTRGLDADVVSYFARKKLLYEDAAHHNAVFIGTDEGGCPRHAHLRSTNSFGKAFRLNVESSDPRYSFHHTGTDGSLYVFEAPIDMLSYISMNPRQWQEHSYVACCGTSPIPVMQMLKPDTQIVYLCLDNDDAGHKASERMAEQLRERGVMTERLVPELKDWNDDLLHGQKEEFSSMPESMTPLIMRRRGGRVVHSSAFASYQQLLLEQHQVQNRWRRPVRNRALGNGSGDPKSLRHGSL